jgi:hypothetical protein
MSQIKPVEILKHVAKAVPTDCLENIVIIGSLAAAYAYFGDDDKIFVRTKDIDCLLKPFRVAAEKGQTITRQLLDAGWQPRRLGKHYNPGTHKTPDDELPAIRLYPPEIDPEEENAWFIELLTEPESSKNQGKKWTRMIIDEGHYGLPSYRYLSVTAFMPEKIDQLGIYYARPQMMALANMLEHSEIKPDRMSTLFDGRAIKRSNKDLGRILAIGYLEEEKGIRDFRQWAYDWKDALQSCFPDEWKTLSVNAGSGLRALLDSGEDMEEAHYTCVYGLLSSYGVSQGDLLEVGERILGDTVDILIKLES